VVPPPVNLLDGKANVVDGFGQSASEKPSWWMRFTSTSGSKIRSTAFSPNAVGIVAKPDERDVALRLEVNVRRALLEGLAEQMVERLLWPGGRAGRVREPAIGSPPETRLMLPIVLFVRAISRLEGTGRPDAVARLRPALRRPPVCV
jgi:hypothetical protein